MEKILENFKKLLYFRTILFLWSIILYSDVYYLFFFHRSIKNFNYEYLIKSIKTLTITNIFTFLMFFSVIYIFIIPQINYITAVLWNELYYHFLYDLFNKKESDLNKHNFCIYPESLKDYSIIHNNKVLFDIYKRHTANLNESIEFNKISLFVVIFSFIDYALSRYNKGICILNIFEYNKLSEYLITGYIALLILLIITIFNEYIDYYNNYVILSREIVSHIRNDLSGFRNTVNSVENHKSEVAIYPEFPKKD